MYCFNVAFLCLCVVIFGVCMLRYPLLRVFRVSFIISLVVAVCVSVMLCLASLFSVCVSVLRLWLFSSLLASVYVYVSSLMLYVFLSHVFVFDVYFHCSLVVS